MKCGPSSKESCVTHIQKSVRAHPCRVLTLLAVTVLSALGLYFAFSGSFCSFEAEIACIGGSSTLALITATFFICLGLKREEREAIERKANTLKKQLSKFIPCVATPSPTSPLQDENIFTNSDDFLTYLLDQKISFSEKKKKFREWRSSNDPFNPSKKYESQAKNWLNEVIVKCLEKKIYSFFKMLGKITKEEQKLIMSKLFQMTPSLRTAFLSSLDKKNPVYKGLGSSRCFLLKNGSIPESPNEEGAVE